MAGAGRRVQVGSGDPRALCNASCRLGCQNMQLHSHQGCQLAQLECSRQTDLTTVTTVRSQDTNYMRPILMTNLTDDDTEHARHSQSLHQCINIRQSLMPAAAAYMHVAGIECPGILPQPLAPGPVLFPGHLCAAGQLLLYGITCWADPQCVQDAHTHLVPQPETCKSQTGHIGTMTAMNASV